MRPEFEMNEAEDAFTGMHLGTIDQFPIVGWDLEKQPIVVGGNIENGEMLRPHFRITSLEIHDGRAVYGNGVLLEE